MTATQEASLYLLAYGGPQVAGSRPLTMATARGLAGKGWAEAVPSFGGLGVIGWRITGSGRRALDKARGKA